MLHDLKSPQLKRDLQILRNFKFTNFDENLLAITQANGDIEEAKKILDEMHSEKHKTSTDQSIISSPLD
jgi:hypothetical protein